MEQLSGRFWYLYLFPVSAAWITLGILAWTTRCVRKEQGREKESSEMISRQSEVAFERIALFCVVSGPAYRNSGAQGDAQPGKHLRMVSRCWYVLIALAGCSREQAE